MVTESLVVATKRHQQKRRQRQIGLYRDRCPNNRSRVQWTSSWTYRISLRTGLVWWSASDTTPDAWRIRCCRLSCRSHTPESKKKDKMSDICSGFFRPIRWRRLIRRSRGSSRMALKPKRKTCHQIKMKKMPSEVFRRITAFSKSLGTCEFATLKIATFSFATARHPDFLFVSCKIKWVFLVTPVVSLADPFNYLSNESNRSSKKIIFLH